MSPTKGDNPERETRILDAAADLIVHYGYDKTTVSDIARQAGVSKGAIYLHFDSKDALFDTLLRREVQRYSERWLELIEADPQGGTMAGVYKNVLRAINSSPFMIAIFKRDRRVLGSYIRKPGNMYEQQGAGSMRHEFLKMMQDAGAVRSDIDVRVMAHIMNMLAYALVAMDDIMPDDDIPPLDDIIEAIAFMMDRALTPDDGGNSEAGKAVIRQITAAARQQIYTKPDENNKEEQHD